MKRLFFAVQVLFLSFFISSAYAADIQKGMEIPKVEIQDMGIMTFDYEIKDNKMAFKGDFDPKFKAWSTSDLKGKVVTIYHLAARMGIDEVNQDFITALKNANLQDKLPDSPYKTITILNLDDAAFGTSGLAKSKFKKSQEENPHALYAIDAKGAALKKWGLEKKSSAVIVLDKEGKVLFFKDGKLSPAEINEAVSAIQNALN